MQTLFLYVNIDDKKKNKAMPEVPIGPRIRDAKAVIIGESIVSRTGIVCTYITPIIMISLTTLIICDVRREI